MTSDPTNFQAHGTGQNHGERDRTPDWYADEALWRALYPVIWPAARFEQAMLQVDQLVQLLGLRSPDVLDLCCGPGRHATPLAALGYRVTGVDRSTFLLDMARQRSERLQLHVEWVEADARTFSRPGAFDLAINWFTSFGYFADPADNERMLRQTCENLRPGGVLVIDVLGKEILARDFQPTTSSELADGTVVLERHRIGRDWRRLYNAWTVIRDGQAFTWEFDHALYAGVELETLLLAAGFATVRLYGDLGGGPYGPDARRLIAVARKADTRSDAKGTAR